MAVSSAFSIAPYFYPRPPGGGRPEGCGHRLPAFAISIHALRVEGDWPSRSWAARCSPVFLSTPSGWRATLMMQLDFMFQELFLSTPSGWRATTRIVLCQAHFVFLSTPSGWRATCSMADRARNSEFLSTPSGWRATRTSICSSFARIISIHALRVEGDCALML